MPIFLRSLIVLSVMAGCLFAVVSTSYTETINYSYDTMGRLTQAVYGDGTIVQYSYDKIGNRLQKTILMGSPSCTYTLSQTGKAFTSGGGSGSLTITASPGSCNWQTTVNPESTSWLSITPPSSTGSGPANYSASANSDCSPRIGTVAIAGHAFTVTQSGSCVLTVNKTGGVSGTVTSIPAGIACGAQCTNPFENGSSVTLTAQAPVGSIFRSWIGCDGPSSIYCNLIIDTARDVTADFAVCATLPVATHPQQGTDGQFASFTEAYRNTYATSLIKVQAINLIENLTLDRAGTYTIIGGYDCNFQNSWLGTIVGGTATISNGSVSMENLIISGSITVTGSGLLITEELILQ